MDYLIVGVLLACTVVLAMSLIGNIIRESKLGVWFFAQIILFVPVVTLTLLFSATLGYALVAGQPYEIYLIHAISYISFGPYHKLGKGVEELLREPRFP